MRSSTKKRNEKMRKNSTYGVSYKFTTKQKITLKNELMNQQQGICPLCNTSLTISESTLDHITPISKGGQNIAQNIQLTHDLCNSKKGDATT
jgi:5-methylcytosine-specific restriction endonuclease McrA